jgi:hypothetical protein
MSIVLNGTSFQPSDMVVVNGMPVPAMAMGPSMLQAFVPPQMGPVVVQIAVQTSMGVRSNSIPLVMLP